MSSDFMSEVTSRRSLDPFRGQEVHYWGDVDQPALTEGEHVLLRATQKLCTEFHDVLIVKENQEFANLNERCAFFADRLRQGIIKALNPDGSHPKYMAVIRQLTNEQNAYELMKICAEYSALSQQKDSYLGKLLSENDDFRQFTILLEWTERSGHRIPEGFSRHVFDDVSGIVGIRENTFRMLSSGQDTEDGRKIGITSDGCACVADRKNENDYYRILFSKIRCGWLEEAEQLCDNVGDCALSALFALRMINRSPQYTPVEPTDPYYTWFSKRDVFKKFVDRTWEQMDSLHWPASKYNIYATLGGRLQPLIDKAATIEDRIWCFSNAASENLLDSYITGKPRDTVEGTPVTIDELTEQINLKHETSPYMHVYFYLLKDDVFGCVVYMAEWIDRNGERAGEHIIRFMANLIVLWRREGVEHDILLGVSIIDRYASRLERIGLHTLLPFYYSFFTDKELMNERLMSAMSNIPSESDRRVFLENSLQSGIDICDLLLRFINSHLDLLRKKNTLEVDVRDCEKAIDCWKWCLLPEKMTLRETIMETNSLIRLLLACDKEDYAREVLALSQNASGNMADRVERADLVKESFIARAVDEHRAHLCYMAGIDKWVELSTACGQTTGNMGELRDIENTKGLHGITGMEVETNRQIQMMGAQRAKLDVMKEEAEKMFLTFLLHSGWRDGGQWKVDIREKLWNDQESSRLSELSRLRTTYYTSVCFLLVSSCQMRGDSQGAMDLARMLSDDSFEIYKDLDISTLQTLLGILHGIGSPELKTSSKS